MITDSVPEICGTLSLNQIHCGDAYTLSRRLPSQNIDCVITSPPYWGFRHYSGPKLFWSDGWEGELGSEPSLSMYLAHLYQIFNEIERVLKPTGSLWVNLGDCYGGSMNFTDKTKSGFSVNCSRYHPVQPIKRGHQEKSLLLVPLRKTA